jgi:hypothetical protein
MGMSGVSTLKAGHSIPAEADLGRFISRDPIGFAGGLNLFNGAGASPVTFVDEGGLAPTIQGASEGQMQRFHALLEATGLEGYFDALPSSIVLAFVGNPGVEMGRALGLGNESTGPLGAHLIDLADLEAILNESDECGKQALGRIVARQMLHHEIFEANEEMLFNQAAARQGIPVPPNGRAAMTRHKATHQKTLDSVDNPYLKAKLGHGRPPVTKNEDGSFSCRYGGKNGATFTFKKGAQPFLQSVKP